MLKDAKQEIAKFIRDVFQQKDLTIINDYVTKAESLKLVKQDIEFVKDQNIHDIEGLNKLQTKVKFLEMKLRDLELQSKILENNKVYDDYQKKIDVEVMQTDILENMIFRDKSEILWF